MAEKNTIALLMIELEELNKTLKLLIPGSDTDPIIMEAVRRMGKIHTDDYFKRRAETYDAEVLRTCRAIDMITSRMRALILTKSDELH